MSRDFFFARQSILNRAWDITKQEREQADVIIGCMTRWIQEMDANL